MWTLQGVRPVVTITGLHQKTHVFGTLTTDGKQLFRQYDTFNQHTFLEYLTEVQKNLGRVILFLDRGTPHYRSKNVRALPRREQTYHKSSILSKGFSRIQCS